ncbi:MAG TPA: UvrD-helicase domain-containing protein, partial [bacterium]
MTTRLEDQQARAQALDADRSFIVQAPAGSGKTELLIQRYLVLLARVDAPEEIVAITFTRKAAAEMRGRILAALESAVGDAPAEEHKRLGWELAKAALARDRTQGWHLRDHPARLRVLTIDAFNLSLVRRMPWLSQLGGAPATVDDARPLFRQAARETLAMLESGGAVAEHAARLLQHLDNQVERSEDLLSVLLSRRDQWLRHLVSDSPAPLRAELEAAWAAIVTEALREVAGGLTSYAGEVAACASHAAEMLRNTQPDAPAVACLGLKVLPPASPAAVAQWRGIAQLLLTNDGDWRKPRGLNKNNGFPSDTAPQKAAKKRMEGLVGALAGDTNAGRVPTLLSILPDPTFTDPEWEVIAALLTLLPEAVQQLRETLRRGGVADFIEIAGAAARALEGRDAEDGVRHLLLDEFQDTSTSQYRLLEQLVVDWQPGDGRTLFLVGDPMQSIYRFREAEVGLFLRAWREGIGPVPLQPVTLRSNFRSDAAIVGWANRTFAGVFPAQPDVSTGAVSYSAAAATHPQAAAQAVHVHPVRVPGEDKAWGVLREAERVADLAWQARKESPRQSVAILVRARTHLAEILPALRAVDVPYHAVEIDA